MCSLPHLFSFYLKPLHFLMIHCDLLLPIFEELHLYWEHLFRSHHTINGNDTCGFICVLWHWQVPCLAMANVSYVGCRFLLLGAYQTTLFNTAFFLLSPDSASEVFPSSTKHLAMVCSMKYIYLYICIQIYIHTHNRFVCFIMLKVNNSLELLCQTMCPEFGFENVFSLYAHHIHSCMRNYGEIHQLLMLCS